MNAVSAALAAREFPRPGLFLTLLMMVVVGAAAAALTSRLDSGAAQSAALIARFDRTAAGIFTLIAVFRTISTISRDADADWMLQLIAAGASRMLHVVTTSIAITAGLFLRWAAAAAAFTTTLMVLTGDTATLADAALMTPLTALMVLSGAAFGAALVTLLGRTSATYIGIMLIAAPWVGYWAAFSLRGVTTVLTPVRFLSYPPPQLYSVLTLAHVSSVVLHVCVMLGIAVICAERRIARRV